MDIADLRFERLKTLLSSSNGQITEEIKQEVAFLVRDPSGTKSTELRKKVNSSVTTEDIMSNLSNIQQPDVVKNTIKDTLSSIFNSTRMSFISEIENYIDCISETIPKEREIPRVVPKSEILKLQNGRLVSAFPGDFEKVLNPEFKQMLLAGYVPSDVKEYQDALKEEYPAFSKRNPTASEVQEIDPSANYLISVKYPLIGTPETDFLKNSVQGIQPSTRVEKIKTSNPDPGSILRDAYDLRNENITVSSDETSLIVDISSSLKNNSNDSFNTVGATLRGEKPTWKISYMEAGNRYYLNIVNNWKYSQSTGLMPETSSYRFSGLLGDTQGEFCDIQTNRDVFIEFFKNSLKENCDINLSESQLVSYIDFLKDGHTNLLESTIRTMFSKFKDNRLLKKLQVNQSSFSNSNELIFLSAINFIPEINEELFLCGKNPHPLNLDEINQIMVSKFNKIGLSNVPTNNILEEKNPIKEAVLLGATLARLRLSVLDYVLKNLVAFDELGYASKFARGRIVNEYVSILSKKDISDNKIYQICERVVNDNYDFLIEQGIIKEEDIIVSESNFEATVDRASFKLPSIKFKSLISALLRKVLGFTKNLLGGKSTNTSISIVSDKINHVFSRKNDIGIYNEKYAGLDTDRIITYRENEQNIIFEKYISSAFFRSEFIGSSGQINSNTLDFNAKVGELGGNGTTSFIEYAEFLHSLINKWSSTPQSGYFSTSIIKDQNIKDSISRLGKLNNLEHLKSFFSNLPKIGIRVNYVVRQKTNLSQNQTLSEYADEFGGRQQLFAQSENINFSRIRSAFNREANIEIQLAGMSRTEKIQQYQTWISEKENQVRDDSTGFVFEDNKITILTLPRTGRDGGNEYKDFQIYYGIPDNLFNSKIVERKLPDWKIPNSNVKFLIHTLSSGREVAVPLTYMFEDSLVNVSDYESTVGNIATVRDDYIKQFKFIKPYILKNENLLPSPNLNSSLDYVEVLPKTLRTLLEVNDEEALSRPPLPYNFSQIFPEIVVSGKKVFFIKSELRYAIIDPDNDAALQQTPDYLTSYKLELEKLQRDRQLYGEWAEALTEKFPSPFSDEEYVQIYSNYRRKFYISKQTEENIQITPNKIVNDRMYCFFDDSIDGTRYYNSLPIEKEEIEIPFEQIFPNSNLDISVEAIYGNISKFYDLKKAQILNNLQQKENYITILEGALSFDKIINLGTIYGSSALLNEKMEKLFYRTKNSLSEIIKLTENIDNYAYKSDYDRRGGDVNSYMNDFGNMGNISNNNNSPFDITKFLITTPVLILKGLAKLTDPNVAVASQIVDAAAAGLLTPKIVTDANGNQTAVSYPGDPLILPTGLVGMALLPVNLAPIIGPLAIGPPFTPLGVTFWIFEPLLWQFAYYRNLLSKSEAVSQSADFSGVSNFTCDKNQDDI